MNKTILVVEDDEVLIKIYKEILELHNYDVETALNGEEGVEKFKQTKPSLVIMDADMPVLNGYEAFKQIKEIDKNANVVIVTGSFEFELKNQEVIKLGLIKEIAKPILVDELLNLAKKYTEIKLEKRHDDAKEYLDNMQEVMFELKLKTDTLLKKLKEESKKSNFKF